jgi:hypothetical protein
MKKLELNEMENVHDGWSWGGCAAGALTSEYEFGAEAEVLCPGAGAIGVAVIGCLFGGEA